MSRTLCLATAFCVATVLTTWSAALAGATGILPPQNPSANLWAKPVYTFTPLNDTSYVVGQPLPACWKWGASGNFVAQGSVPRCVDDAIAATDRAHRAEGLPAMRLPSNFAALSVPEQLLVLVDIERVSRGEPPVLGVSAALNVYAETGARRNTDPLLPSAAVVPGATGDWAANYAAGVNSLDANYQWMYTDGWQGKDTFNGACTSAQAPGCWGHRDNILADASTMPCSETSCSLVMGAGYVHDGSGGFNSYTELFVQVTTAPTLYYTWSEALAAGVRA